MREGNNVIVPPPIIPPIIRPIQPTLRGSPPTAVPVTRSDSNGSRGEEDRSMSQQELGRRQNRSYYDNLNDNFTDEVRGSVKRG